MAEGENSFMRDDSLQERQESRRFYRAVVALVIPMALQNLINVAVTSADVVMLGRVGETVLSASSLAGQVQFVMTLFFFGLTSGAAVLTAQYWGKGDIRTIEKVMGIALRFSLLVSVLFTAAAWLVVVRLRLREIFSRDALLFRHDIQINHRESYQNIAD